MVEQTYRVDMIPNGVPLVVHVSQYDTEARTLIFELYKGDVAYEVPAGAVASIAGTKPDKTAFIYPMAIDGNVVSIDLKQQMAIVAGDVLAEIQITDSAGKIGSANFVIRVERGPIDENSVISETDIPIFEQLVSDAQTAANEAQTAAEDAADAAESVGSIVPASTGTAGQVLTKKATGADWENLQWGGITGALTDQTDLASALDAKADKTMLAPVESTSTASQNYAVGDYLVYNGILYSVTAAISVGESLTPGTNISATSAGAELTTLKNGLTTMNGDYKKLTKTGTTCTLTFPTGGRYAVLESCNGAQSMAGFLVTVYGNGTTHILELGKGSELTLTTGTNSVTLTSVPNVTFGIMVFRLDTATSISSVTIS